MLCNTRVGPAELSDRGVRSFDLGVAMPSFVPPSQVPGPAGLSSANNGGAGVNH